MFWSNKDDLKASILKTLNDKRKEIRDEEGKTEGWIRYEQRFGWIRERKPVKEFIEKAEKSIFITGNSLNSLYDSPTLLHELLSRGLEVKLILLSNEGLKKNCIQPVSYTHLVLSEVSRQMDEKIVRERLEETISYNVSREKKWYVRITPLALKTRITRLIFLRNTRAYTLTLSNLGAVEMKEGLRDSIRDFHVIIGVSKKQPVKCGVAAFGDKVDITFSSASQDRRLQDYFYGWLDEQGVLTGREENGVVASPYALSLIHI